LRVIASSFPIFVDKLTPIFLVEAEATYSHVSRAKIMDKQPLIFRPNSFTRDEWDNLSREQQIQWWKDQQPKSVRPVDPLRFVEHYSKGITTRNELKFAVFRCIVPANIHAFLDGCPPDILQDLNQFATTFPEDDDEQQWQQTIFIQGRTEAPWTTAEEIEKEDEERKKCFREGLRIFRENTRNTGN
jgi:hypothetical protein